MIYGKKVGKSHATFSLRLGNDQIFLNLGKDAGVPFLPHCLSAEISSGNRKQPQVGHPFTINTGDDMCKTCIFHGNIYKLNFRLFNKPHYIFW